MNTDVILDFFVEYYVWFIIGGAILVMALIGFIAEKKKLLTKNSEIKEETNDIENDQLEQNTVDSNNEFVSNDSTNVSIGEENPINYSENNWNDEQSVNPKEENVYSEEIFITEDKIDSNLVQNEDNEFEKINTNEPVQLYDGEDAINEFDELYKKNIENVQENVEEPINNFNQVYNLKEESVQNSKTEELVNNFSPLYEVKEESDLEKSEELENNSNTLSETNFENNIEADIENINKIEFVKDDNDKKLQITDFEENLDQPLQINYAQLKELVEDIIAEKQNSDLKKDIVENEEYIEKVESVPSTNLSETNIGKIEDISLPNLDHIVVDNIKQQDEDEDDVWKF